MRILEQVSIFDFVDDPLHGSLNKMHLGAKITYNIAQKPINVEKVMIQDGVRYLLKTSDEECLFRTVQQVIDKIEELEQMTCCR